MPEVWLRGALPDVEPLLMPVIHSFLQVHEDIDAAVAMLSDAELWHTPGGAASVGFHVRHAGGSTQRLMTYARGERLTTAQLDAAAAESAGPIPRSRLLEDIHTALDAAVAQVRATDVGSLLQARAVGRAGLPSTTIGLLFHAAEHATRHAGQAITTALIVSRNGSAS